MKILRLTFNPFSENTYVLAAGSGECLIIDPGMADEDENKELFDLIERESLKPQWVVNTHCHLDHVLGNASACKKYSIGLAAHRMELPMLAHAPTASLMWGVPYSESPAPTLFLADGEQLRVGDIILNILFVPGHSPGHVALVHHASGSVISGDVLFRRSVGRVDLPMCNPEELVSSIREKLYQLPEHYIVYPGHGEETTIGEEKRSNPFVPAL